MKKNQLFLQIGILSALLTLGLGCTAQAKAPAAEAASETDSTLIWQLSVDESEITDSISSAKAFVEYGGNVNQVSFTNPASEGNVYLLVLMNIDKSQPGKEKFVWSDLCVTDADGNAYPRMENDTFLETHGLPRIKSTDLSIGNNHGYICFELPDSLDFSKLTLVYAAEDSAQKIVLSPSESK